MPGPAFTAALSSLKSHDAHSSSFIYHMLLAKRDTAAAFVMGKYPQIVGPLLPWCVLCEELHALLSTYSVSFWCINIREISDELNSLIPSLYDAVHALNSSDMASMFLTNKNEMISLLSFFLQAPLSFCLTLFLLSVTPHFPFFSLLLPVGASKDVCLFPRLHHPIGGLS